MSSMKKGEICMRSEQEETYILDPDMKILTGFGGVLASQPGRDVR